MVVQAGTPGQETSCPLAVTLPSLGMAEDVELGAKLGYLEFGLDELRLELLLLLAKVSVHLGPLPLLPSTYRSTGRMDKTPAGTTVAITPTQIGGRGGHGGISPHLADSYLFFQDGDLLL